jgi:hypothetical protein
MLERKNLAKLIQYIAFEVQDRDIPILRTRLVKLLYLVELEYYRSKELDFRIFDGLDICMGRSRTNYLLLHHM